MKIAPLMSQLEHQDTIEPVLVHTGQHYDESMSKLFFQQLGIPEPDINLEVGSESHAVQTARIMERFETVCRDVQPSLVLVFGDVNSTVACALVPAKLGIKAAHYEAGLRSRDRTMPEEINRVATDAICDYFFTTGEDANENLLREGKEPAQIFLVGNLMIDTLYLQRDRLEQGPLQIQNMSNHEWSKIGRNGFSDYGVITLHRPSNVDEPATLKRLIGVLCAISQEVPLIFPAHPRTHHSLLKYGCGTMLKAHPKLILSKPNGYLQFMRLMISSRFAITDSGGVQEETTALDIPCLTVRPNTERPITISEGTNKLVTLDEIEDEVGKILRGQGKRGKVPPLWDGSTAPRMVKILEGLLN
ncbi:UDP-N-acetylglucosamine 2-epimerase (non-hydrolyzing) [bacterium]|nr:UDP-N-acetylglucosamine 2-epimerase (non-hydrolyzing) [bacterium]